MELGAEAVALGTWFALKKRAPGDGVAVGTIKERKSWIGVFGGRTHLRFGGAAKGGVCRSSFVDGPKATAPPSPSGCGLSTFSETGGERARRAREDAAPAVAWGLRGSPSAPLLPAAE